MTLNDLKQLIEEVEPRLNESVFVTLHQFERNGRPLSLAITDRLRRACRKGRVWKSKPMLTALKNAGYGFERSQAQSPGGHDGIFIITRDYRPKNEMMKKLFDQFIDKPESGADAIAKALKTPLKDLIPVRLVSHHMRLLGLLKTSKDGDTLVLVEYDDGQ